MNTPLNKQTLKQHLTYSWWKYALFAVLAIFAIDIIYTVTAYRSPEEKKVQIYVYGFSDSDKLDSYMAKVQETEMSDMEVMESLTLTTDETYGPIQLSVYLGAGEGDIYVLPKDNFVSLASDGTFVPLEDDEELLKLFEDAGVSIKGGWRKESESGETHLYGIPLSALPGLDTYVYAEDGYLAISIANGNTENVIKFLKILCRDMITAEEEAATEDAAVSTAADTASQDAEVPATTDAASQDADVPAITDDASQDADVPAAEGAATQEAPAA